MKVVCDDVMTWKCLYITGPLWGNRLLTNEQRWRALISLLIFSTSQWTNSPVTGDVTVMWHHSNVSWWFPISVPHSVVWITTRAITMSAFWEYPPPPLDYSYYWFISELDNKIDMRHTFWSFLKRYINMKWIWQVLWKIHSRHLSIQTDGQTDKWNQYTPLPTSLKKGV